MRACLQIIEISRKALWSKAPTMGADLQMGSWFQRWQEGTDCILRCIAQFCLSN